MSEIIIASTSIDEPTYGPVAEKLQRNGFDVFVYSADRVASGKDSLSIGIQSDGELAFSYNGEEKRLENMRAGWYRHPNLTLVEDDDKAKQLSIEQEVINLQEFLWQRIPGALWLNAPDRIKKAQIKLGQLVTAGALGLITPSTVVANNWGDINANLPSDDVVMKMSKGILYEDNQTKVLYSTRLKLDESEGLAATRPFPAIFQTYERKAREWRVTVVGEEVFEAAIYTTDGAKDDWRKHQFTDRVTFRKESLSDDIKEKCFLFLGEYGLRYGAFDFIEDDDGKITFLECNPNGQFMWLEKLLNLPISDAIASELIKIASATQ